MADLGLNIKVLSDNAPVKELAELLSKVAASFGGATAERVKKDVAGMVGAVKKATEETVKASVAAGEGAASKLKEVTERRIQFEKQAESLKFEQLKEKYKELVTAHQNAQQAMKEASSKEDKAELKSKIEMLKQEKQAYADTLRERPETKKGKASDVGMLGTKREVSASGGGLMEIAGIGAAAEGLSTLVEKSKEASDYAVRMKTAYGSGPELEKAKKDAEELGDQFGMTGEQAGGAMAKIKAATAGTGATQQQVVEYTKAYIAAQQSGLQISVRSLMTEKGRQNMLAQGGPLIANAMKAAQDPAKQAQLAMAKVEETVGDLAAKLLSALGPVLKAINPLITELGDTVGALLTPALAVIVPVVAQVGVMLKQLMPPISQLLKAGFGLIMPVVKIFTGILSDIIPVIEKVVGTVVTALTPVFKALTPIIQEVAGLFGDLAKTYLQAYFIPVLNILLPILTQLLVPVLMSLMPLLKMIADIASAILTPAMKLLGGILQWIVTNAIQPLVTWLTGNLAEGVKEVVKIITDAVGAITHVVGAITSFLGLGDKAKGAAHANGVAVGAAIAAGVQQGVANTPPIAPPKMGKKKKKSGPSPEELAKKEADRVLAVAKDADMKADETDAEHKAKQLAAEEAHATALLAIAKKYHKADSVEVANADMAVLALQQGAAAEKKKALAVEQKKFDAAYKTALKKRLDEQKQAAVNFAAAQKEIEKGEVDAMVNGDAKKIAQEHLAYEEQLAQLRKGLEDKKLTGAQYDTLESQAKAAHESVIQKIQQASIDKQKKAQMQQMAFLLGPFSSAFNQAFGQVDKIMQKSTATMFGHKTAFSQMMGEVVTGYAKMGVAAIMHANISQVADAAAAAGKFALAAASAIASAFETIPFPLDIVAAGAALAGVILLASKAKSIKLAEGGILTRPTFARNYEAGEAGHEAVIPLSSSRGQDALGTKALGEKIDKSNQLMSTQNEHLSAIRKAGQPTGGHYSPSAMYGAQAGINRALVIANRRVMK